MITIYDLFFDEMNHLQIEPSNDNSFKMPGGEWHVQLAAHAFTNPHDKLLVVRASSADDLIGLRVIADAVHRTNRRVFGFIPYLPGARQDRAPFGEALTSRVYAEIINDAELDAVFCLDPHSPVMPALLNSVQIVPQWTFFKGLQSKLRQDVGCIIAPDSGAAKRCFEAAQFFQVPLAVAEKHRNMTTGALEGFGCSNLPDIPNDTCYVLFDDICDGGGTFIGLMDALIPTGKIRPDNTVLAVTHGIFSGAAVNLKPYFSQIVCTDSWHTFNPDANVFKVVSLTSTRDTIPTNIIPIDSGYIFNRVASEIEDLLR